MAERQSHAARPRVVIVDEDDQSRRETCAILSAAGYDAVGVGSSLGLDKVLKAELPTLILVDVSPPATWEEVIESIKALRVVTGDRWPIAVCGDRVPAQLDLLARACRSVGVVVKDGTKASLVDGVGRFLPLPRLSLRVDDWGSDRKIPSSRRESGSWALVKLLLIDDSEITLELMQGRLRQIGFDVRIALALGEVNSIVRGWSPNVIVADVNMPDIRGDKLCTKLRSAVGASDVMMILCSSMPEEELRDLADSAGADAFVSKNLGIEYLVDQIQTLCRRMSDPIISIQ